MICDLNEKYVILNNVYEARQSNDDYHFMKIKFLIDTYIVSESFTIIHRIKEQKR